MTQLSPVVAGLWKMHQWPLGAQGRLRWIEGAVELGITSFDHADIYGGYSVEALFGEALALAPGLRQRLQQVGQARRHRQEKAQARPLPQQLLGCGHQQGRNVADLGPSAT
ncbi:MAG: aldo/keto reductase, partial [Betaproteobacteria bacterium]